MPAVRMPGCDILRLPVPDPRDLLEADDDDSTAVVSSLELDHAPQTVRRDRYLIIRAEGSEIGQIQNLRGAELLIGRHPSCDLSVQDGGVSRRHARLAWSGSGYAIEDLGSANGTYVNGNRISSQGLRDGDIIQVGPNIVYRYAVTDADQEAMLQHLYDASVTDALTGANNREYFDSRLATELAYARRHSVELSLMMMDIDHFKHINDSFGHQAGDLALVELVRTIRGRLRAEDVFCRYGGEEFAVILRTTDLVSAGRAAERVRREVQQLQINYQGRIVPITISIGCASLACCSEGSSAELISIADRRLYVAKRSGRNRVAIAG